MAKLGQETKAYLNRKNAGLVALADNIGKQMERYAKSHAPWEDRTAAARQRLSGGGEKMRGGALIYLGHGVQYGRYLEEGTGLYGPAKRSFDIYPRQKKALSWQGASHPVKVVKNHPGMRPRPIIHPTADHFRPRIRETVREYWSDET